MINCVPIIVTDIQVVVVESSDFQVVKESGEQGPPGIQGADGRAQQYEFTQAVPSSIWHILHNRGNKPLVSVRDTGGNEVVVDVEHTDNTQLYIRCSPPLAGTAVLI